MPRTFYPDTKSPSLPGSPVTDEGSRVGYGDGSRVARKKLEKNRIRIGIFLFGSGGPGRFFPGIFQYLPSKERSNISSPKGKRKKTSTQKCRLGGEMLVSRRGGVILKNPNIYHVDT